MEVKLTLEQRLEAYKEVRKRTQEFYDRTLDAIEYPVNSILH